jgi:protocatechuate 3,4-dioxygenase beta subunit
MQRRKFLGAGAALAALAAPKWLRGQDCRATQWDLYGTGPFYLPEAPARTRIARASEPGVPLSISGTVSNCKTPVPGVKLEVWQATDSGCYIYPQARCDLNAGDDEEARLWGQLTTDAEGRFAFETIKPGRYLNGDRYRPSHIHFRITAPGRVQGDGGADLVTQLYFEGDEYIQGDYAADHESAAGRIIPLVEDAGTLRGTFNVNLPGLPSGLGVGDPLLHPTLAEFDAAVVRRGFRILFQLPAVPTGQPVEMRLHGADGTLVKRVLHRVMPVELDASLLPRGRYFAEFRWWTRHGLRTERVRVGI